jgi:hypothetical protein
MCASLPSLLISPLTPLRLGRDNNVRYQKQCPISSVILPRGELCFSPISKITNVEGPTTVMLIQSELKRDEESCRDHSCDFEAARTKTDTKPSPKTIPKDNLPKDFVLTVPLSFITAGLNHVSTMDIGKWVNRSASTRRGEVKERHGYIPRPPNSFILYRSAYIERARALCGLKKEQILSKVIATSWNMEPPEVRQRYEQYAKLERANHFEAHSMYKFSPKRRRLKDRGKLQSTSHKHRSPQENQSPLVPEGHERSSPPLSSNMIDHLACSISNLIPHGTWESKPTQTLRELPYDQYQQHYKFEDDVVARDDTKKAYPIDTWMADRGSFCTSPYANMDTCYVSPSSYHYTFFPCMYLGQAAFMYSGIPNEFDQDSSMVGQMSYQFVSNYDFNPSYGYSIMHNRLDAVQS